MVTHVNTSQRAYSPSFNPLLRNEGPYYANLNRAPKNAYDYAEHLNTMFSHAGSVSRLQPQSTSTVYNLYDVVLINSNERIEPAFEASPAYGRYGILVSTVDTDGYYLVVLHTPNFVYPIGEVASGTGFAYTATEQPPFVYVNPNSTIAPMLATTPSSPDPTHIGAFPIGVVTGSKSIAFFGTYRQFPVASPGE